MLCPNCQEKLTTVKFGQVEVFHCPNCGGSFFEENEINRLSFSQAKKLAVDKKNGFISAAPKFCPKDNLPMKAIQEESVPQFVTLLKCEKCQGVFAFPDDLVNFKKAQQTKLNFFKTWRLPLPSLKSILVYSFLILTTVSLFSSFQAITTNQSLKTQADDVIKSIKISAVNNTTVVYFITKVPFQSEAVFFNQQTGQEIRRIISKEPAKTHFLTVRDIAPSETTALKIILISGKTRITTQPILFVPK